MFVLDTATAIVLGIALCALLLLALIFRKMLKDALRLTLRAVCGMILIALINSLLPIAPVGINVVTVAVCALLGLPGLAALYIIAWVF
jgi:pro-sigmaK processing inhibitor BofA